MNGRVILRVIGAAGAFAIVGQTAAYTWISRHDPVGTSRRLYSLHVDEGTVRISHPNTWRVRLHNRRPEFRLDLLGPGGLRVVVVGSTALKAGLPTRKSADERQVDPLGALHTAARSMAAQGLSAYAEDDALPSSALAPSSMFSLYEAQDGRGRIRGVRYSMLGARRAWCVSGSCPEASWGRCQPVLNALVRRMELP